MLTINEMPGSIAPGVRIDLDKGRDAYVSTSEPVVQTINSTLPVENYVIFGQRRGPQVFNGEVRYEKIKEYKYQLANVEYYNSLEIEARLLKYDQTGEISRKATNSGYAWSRGIDTQIWDTLSFGASAISYDATPFFGAGHVDLDSGVQSNIAVGASGLDATTLRVMQAAFAGFKDDRGQLMGRKLTHVVVKTGTLNAITAKQLANGQFVVGTNNSMAMNPFMGSFEIIETPYLGASVQYVGLDLSTMEKPIIRQASGVKEFIAMEKDSEHYANHKTYRYVNHEEWGVGYNDWRLAYLQI